MPDAFSILHISDLHRSREDPVTNAELLQALAQEWERYSREEPKIRAPDAAIVSGDIVQGVPIGTPPVDAATEFDRQYEVAYDFLHELAERFFEGDHARIVIIPGNHDVDWVTARAAMEPVELDDWPANLLSELNSPNSPFRLDLNQRPVALYRVSDLHNYEARFQRYRAFQDRFYRATSAVIEVPGHDYVKLFELNNERIVVAAFNSCENNDCYSRRGAIPKGAIAQTCLQIGDGGKPYELRVAVWHHGVQGGPAAVDYMDIDLVWRLISSDFRLGLHGHQHRSEAMPHQIRLPEPRSMVLVSAGSLCAGPRELPTGTNRQYNVIELNGSLDEVRVHVRELGIAMQFGPRHLAAFGGRTYTDLDWQPPRTPVGTTPDMTKARLTKKMLEAENALRSADHDAVESLLRPEVASLNLHGRQLLVQAAIADERWQDVARTLTQPQSIIELTQLIKALGAAGKFDDARKMLSTFANPVGLDSPAEDDLQSWISSQEAVHGK